MPSKTIAIHGHFYQPDRFIPEIGLIPKDPIAKAQSDGKRDNWNEVIFDQCYQPNTELGNFADISFDLYRSLFDWLRIKEPLTLEKILGQAQRAKKRDGETNILAGSYDHAILPLLKRTDVEIEIYWGIAHYKHFLGFSPVGFWLPETAVNHTVLEVLAMSGIRYTIFASWQAKGNVDTSKVYTITQTQNQAIKAVFYNATLSQGLSFDNAAATSVRQFAGSYLAQPSFLLGACDGERFGHHFLKGATFLNQLIAFAKENYGYNLTTLGKFIDTNKPAGLVTILENTSWSCQHKLLRWKGDCPCNYDNLSQHHIPGVWKELLWQSISRLSRELDIIIVSELSALVKDPQQIRKEYILVILGEKTIREVCAPQAVSPLTEKQLSLITNLLEIDRYKRASFTSCGFFFADIDRPEPRICIHNARAALDSLKNVKKTTANNLEKQFVALLASITSSMTGVTAKDIYYEYSK